MDGDTLGLGLIFTTLTGAVAALWHQNTKDKDRYIERLEKSETSKDEEITKLRDVIAGYTEKRTAIVDEQAKELDALRQELQNARDEAADLRRRVNTGRRS